MLLGRDENIFEIEQGVCVSVLGRDPTAQRAHYYRSLPGPEAFKSEWLRTTALCDAETQSVGFEPTEPYYLWVANRGADALHAYDSWPKVNEVFQLYSSGIQTKRDGLTIHFSKDELLSTIREFSSLPVEAARIKFGLPDDGRDWTVAGAQEDLRKHRCDAASAIEILYRPFDKRWTYFTGKTKGFLGYPRRAVMQHMVGRQNIGLVVNRQVVSDRVTHFGVTHVPNCHGTYYLGNKGQDYLLPLYRYEAPTPLERRSGIKDSRRTPNLAPSFVRRLENATGLSGLMVGHGDLVGTFGPDDVLPFLLAVLHSQSYRTRYDDRLHVDFPRVPTSPSRGLFVALVPLGSALVLAHTLAPEIQTASDVQLIGGDFRIKKIPSRNKALPAQQGRTRVPINADAWFDGVSDEDWRFEVGGYQPLFKWLEARKKAARTLGDEDIRTFRRIVTALRTIRGLMGEIDDVIAAHGGWPNAFAASEPKS